MAAAFACAGTALLASPALATTETFNYTGAAQTWTVPAGVTSASFDLFGAQGGLISTNSPGLGGHATATISLTAGDSIQVNVGGRGEGFPSSTTAGAGGFNGGGNGTAQGGGGASDIRIGGTTVNQRVLVAGGGGGSGNCVSSGQTSNGGGGGGLMGADGFEPPGTTGCAALDVAGGGGTPNAGGSGTLPATLGTFGSGGTASIGGGGGGGWYGGGGGSFNGAGGGGSGNGPAGTTFETGVHSGDGLVTITYTAPTPTAGEHPNCKKLRKKLKRQQKGLANAGTEAKRAMIQANIKDTKKRLKKRGCKPASK